MIPTPFRSPSPLSPRGPLGAAAALLALIAALLPAAAGGSGPGRPASGGEADAAVRTAVAAGDVEALAAALARGGAAEQARKFGVTLLMDAAESGPDRLVELLLAGGAAVGAVTAWNETALSYAVRGGDPAVVGRLLAAGADVNHRARHRFTPLAVAVGAGRPEIVHRLLAAGADPNAAVQGGATPLMLAAGRGRLEIARALLDAGARLDARDEAGRDALAIAVEGGHEETIAFFERATGRRAERPALAAAGGAAGEIGEIDFRRFRFELEGRPVEVRDGLHAALAPDDLAVDAVGAVLGDLGGDGAREAAVLVTYRTPDGEERTQLIVFGVRDGRLVELGRPPRGTAGADAVVAWGFAAGRLEVRREAPGGTRRIELWGGSGSALEPAAAP